MEQEAVFDVGDFDERNISLNETPRNPSHYLQQVSVSRARCPEVVTAKVIPQKVTSSAISKDLLFSCEPPSEWSLIMSDKFSMQRSLVDAQRSHWKKSAAYKWPSLKDPDEWRIFCLEERNSSFPLETKLASRFAHHRGNPPTLRLVLSMSEQQVNAVIQYLVEVFIDEGYARPLFEWIYALLLVLQKPLLHDVCSAIRQLAKHSRILRNTLDDKLETDSTIREEFSLFIAIVGVYFEQLDIADQISC
uniref:Gem-associated protein 2 n=1 Tax=Setaria digitata TaxID=48799 RepID=A0A915PN02_9BILA